MPRILKYDKGYRFNFRHHGRRYEKRFPDRQSAQDAMDAIIGGRIGRQVSLEDTIRKYLIWCEKTGKKKPSTLRSDTQRLSTFRRWAGDNRISHIGSVRVDELRAFYAWFLANHPLYSYQIQSERSAHATWERYRAILSALFKWAVEQDILEVNPIAGRKEFSSKQQEPAIRWFTDDELAKLLKYDGCLFFRFLVYTGLRVSEALELKWRQVDLDNGLVHVSGNTKNYRNRSVPISGKLRKHLRPASSGAFVFARNGKSLRQLSDSMYKRLRATLVLCDIDPAGLHAFRHTFATGLARGGAHPKEIQELLGHQSMKMAMRYAHFEPKYLKKSIARLPF